jgi:hypothetical protein
MGMARYPDFWAARRIGPSFEPGRIAAGRRAVWIADQWLPVVVGVDPVTGEPGEPISLSPPAGRGGGRLFAGEGAAWVLGGQALTRIDEETRSVEVVSTLQDGFFQDLAVGAGAAWTLQDHTITRIDASTGQRAVFVEARERFLAIGAVGGRLLVAQAGPTPGHVTLVSYSTSSTEGPERVVIRGSLERLRVGTDFAWAQCIRWG